jgi:hypothetical protein
MRKVEKHYRIGDSVMLQMLRQLGCHIPDDGRLVSVRLQIVEDCVDFVVTSDEWTRDQASLPGPTR